MNRIDTIQSALAGAFWDSHASPYAMTRDVLKATGNEDIAEEQRQAIEKTINRVVMAKELVAFSKLAGEVAAMLPAEQEPPPMTENQDRAERARTALQTYVEGKGEVFENNSDEIADLMADLMHLVTIVDQSDSSVESTFQRAYMHFETELNATAEASAPALDDDDDGKPPELFAHLFGPNGEVL